MFVEGVYFPMVVHASISRLTTQEDMRVEQSLQVGKKRSGKGPHGSEQSGNEQSIL